jgi:DNA-binding transcriptional regulator YdaS (Cro superfamily)
MNLRAYLDSLPRGGVTAVAERCGISTVYLSQLAARQGGREAGPELAVVIERATELQVRRWDLRPKDWWRIWPELIGIEGAPGGPGVTPANHPAQQAAPGAAAAAGSVHVDTGQRRRVTDIEPHAAAGGG